MPTILSEDSYRFYHEVVSVPAAVRSEFGVGGEVIRLSGGSGPAFRVGDTVVKPVADSVEAAIVAEAMHRVRVDADVVRVARPVRAANGGWVVEGWTAWRWEQGQTLGRHHPWAAALAAVDGLQRGLSVMPRPVGLDDRSHRWARADRIAWGEQEMEVFHPDIKPLVERLWARLEPLVGVPSQLVHGDLYGNLLFDEHLPPAVIDFSPNWRPAGFGKAVYVADALGAGGDRRLVDLVIGDAHMSQLLARAALFRLLAIDAYSQQPDAETSGHLRFCERMVTRLIESGEDE